MTDWPNITSMPAFEVKYVSAYIAITIYKMTTAEVLIKYCGNFKYVTVQKDCSATDFLSAVIRDFKIQSLPDARIDFLNPQGAIIEVGKLWRIIADKYNCGYFYVEVRASYIEREQASTGIYTSDDLRLHLISIGHKDWIKEFEKNGQLTKATRTKLMTVVVDLINSKFGYNVASADVRMLCRATVNLFTDLKVDPSNIDGIDLLYNTGASNGWVYTKLRNQRQKRQQSNKENPLAQMADTNEFLSQDEKKQHILFFRTCVMPKDMEKLKEVMKKTVQFRKELLKKSDFGDIFKFYFSCPDLILYDYDLMFGLNELSLKAVWPNVEKHITDMIENEPSKLSVTEYDEHDLECFLFMLKSLRAHNCSIKTSLRSYIIYSQEQNADPVDLATGSTHPILIGIGCNLEEKTVWYIPVEDNIITIPHHYSFVDVMDLFYKAHKVFNIQYHRAIKPMMQFIEYYFYGCKDNIRLTPTLQTVSKSLEL